MESDLAQYLFITGATATFAVVQILTSLRSGSDAEAVAILGWPRCIATAAVVGALCGLAWPLFALFGVVWLARRVARWAAQ